MTIMKHLAIGIGVIATAGAAPARAGPACSDIWDYAVHGQHIVNDYVVGDEAFVDWPPSGDTISEIVSGSGAAIPGGPGPGAHFSADPPVAPGASFCNDAKSPGAHYFLDD